jgi:hypothetical protein
MTQEKFMRIMSAAKTICIAFFWACISGSLYLGYFIFPSGAIYQALLLLLWIVGVIPYVAHYIFIPLFIERVLKIKIEK